jgi:hypothetical protein
MVIGTDAPGGGARNERSSRDSNGRLQDVSCLHQRFLHQGSPTGSASAEKSSDYLRCNGCSINDRMAAADCSGNRWTTQ